MQLTRRLALYMRNGWEENAFSVNFLSFPGEILIYVWECVVLYLSNCREYVRGTVFLGQFIEVYKERRVRTVRPDLVYKMTCCPFGQNKQDRHSREIDKFLEQHNAKYRMIHRLLLLGAGESGKSTLVKQMKILHQNGFQDTERLDMVKEIRRNVREAVITVLKAMDCIEPRLTLDRKENCGRAEWLLQYATCQDFEYPSEFYDHVKALWKDKGFLECYERSNEYQLIDSAKYFFDSVDRISENDYMPTDQDILRCRVLTTEISETKFTIGTKPGKMVTFHMFDVGGQRDQRRKWIQCFNDVTAIIFVVSCSSYDIALREDHTRNRLQESIDLFRQIWNNRFLKYVSIILFLNKQDLLGEKILAGKSRMEDYFADFAEYRTPDKAVRDAPDEVLRARYFIRDTFLQVAGDRTGSSHDDHDCYPHFTCAVDTKNIERIFDSCRFIIQREHLKNIGVLPPN